MESKKELEQAVACILANWPALEIAVDNHLGGPLGREKARWLVQVTSEFMTTDECECSQDIQEYLGILMDQEFDTLVEDGSLEEVSQQLFGMLEEFKKGGVDRLSGILSSLMLKQRSASFLEVLLPTPPEKPKQSVPRSSSASAMDTGDSNSSSSSTLTSSKDDADDGWTVVTKRKH